MKNLSKEKVQGIIIVILLLVIVFGGSYFISEIKSCDTNNTTSSEKSLNSISYEEYKELKKEDDLSIIYIARPGCSFCQKQEPIVKELIKEYDLTINYMNTDDMSSEEIEELINSYDVFEGGEKFGTPTILLVQKDKIVDSTIGYTEKDSLIEFFTKHELIKE